MAYADFIDLNRTTASDKTLCDKALLLPKSKVWWISPWIALMVYKFFDKKTSATVANKFSVSGIKNENMSGSK